MSTKSALVAVANGSEDIETATIIDVLRRAGVAVTVASAEALTEVTCAHGLRITCDTLVGAVRSQHFDLIALPGGMPGAERLRDCRALIGLLQEQQTAGGLYAAICASPGVVLGTHGLIGARKATAYPGFEQLLPAGSACGDAVVRDGNLITGRGPAAAMAFALALVEALLGRAKAEQVAASMLTSV